uniref:Uncharacterized protein MANES_08G036200 n=2 Tax=Rhizophora mucronata TaxID=61149 RepID=A0A2P2J5F7_RHIMU
MGWVWRDDETESGEIGVDAKSKGAGGDDVCSTRKVVRSRCSTEEVEPGKFVRKCEKSEELLKECLGKPAELLESNKEYTEDDVTDLVTKGSFPMGKFESGPFGLPGLRSDIEGIEHHFLGGVNRFFEAAEEMRNSIFDIFGEFHDRSSSSSPSTKRGIPIEVHPRVEDSANSRARESGDVDLSGLAKDV